jgi:hypothetical protein
MKRLSPVETQKAGAANGTGTLNEIAPCELLTKKLHTTSIGIGTRNRCAFSGPRAGI